MEPDEETNEEIEEGESILEPPSIEEIFGGEFQLSQQASQPDGKTKGDYSTPKCQIWGIIIIAIWIIGLYGAFYYFLITHRAVTYVIGG